MPHMTRCPTCRLQATAAAVGSGCSTPHVCQVTGLRRPPLGHPVKASQGGLHLRLQAWLWAAPWR
jgi:hypothetical protein